jgi:small neutral amino acid transporter SnatA (MarC family)
MTDPRFFWEVLITLLVITDPPGVVPPFLGLTSGVELFTRIAGLLLAAIAVQLVAESGRAFVIG